MHACYLCYKFKHIRPTYNLGICINSLLFIYANDIRWPSDLSSHQRPMYPMPI